MGVLTHRHTQILTHTHTDGTDSLTSNTDAGGNKMWSSNLGNILDRTGLEQHRADHDNIQFLWTKKGEKEITLSRVISFSPFNALNIYFYIVSTDQKKGE